MVVVAIVLSPLIVIFYESGNLSYDRWATLWSASIPELLWKTVKLALLVAFFTVIMGVSVAWLVTRRRFKGRTLVIWLMVMPLAIPTYVYADIYMQLFSDKGWLGWFATFWNDTVLTSSLIQGLSSIWSWLTGDSATLYEFTSLLSVAFVLSFASFSYVFLLVRTSLGKSTQSLEEAARIQGANAQRVFWKINFPLMRPAIAASMAIVILHTISDFGAVSKLQYSTFTQAIYTQYMRNSSDLGMPAALSMVLVVMAMTFLIVERFFRSRQQYYSSDKEIEQKDLKPLHGIEKIIVWGWIGLIGLFAVGLPVGWILVQSFKALIHGQIGWVLWNNTVSSFAVAAAAATLALIAAFPIAYFHSRRKTFLSATCMHASNVGFVLPGPIIALGALIIGAFIFDGVTTFAYFFIWIAAITIRYLPLAVQSQESLLQQLTPSIEQAGRILGATPWENFKRVILPVIKPGMISAWVLVFIDALKELPAALLLRPQGTTTLPVMIWAEENEEMLEATAPASLMLILATLPAIWLMMRGQKLRKDS